VFILPQKGMKLLYTKQSALDIVALGALGVRLLKSAKKPALFEQSKRQNLTSKIL
jgi:hypothetical protein